MMREGNGFTRRVAIALFIVTALLAAMALQVSPSLATKIGSHSLAIQLVPPTLASSILPLSPPANPPSFTVNSLADVVASLPLDNGVCETNPGNGICTLRAAIMKANHFPGGGVIINIPAGTYGLTIPPAGTDDETTGDLNITADMTINGAGAANTIIDAKQIDRAFQVGTFGGNAPTVTISGVTIRNGKTTGSGGGLFNNGILTLNNCLISANQTLIFGSGGGLVNQNTMTLNATRV